jgi:hypothetical protein
MLWLLRDFVAADAAGARGSMRRRAFYTDQALSALAFPAGYLLSQESCEQMKTQEDKTMKRLFFTTFLVLGVLTFATGCSTTANTRHTGGWDNTTAGTHMGTAGVGTDNTTLAGGNVTSADRSEESTDGAYGTVQPMAEGSHLHGLTRDGANLSGTTSGTVTTTAGTTVGMSGTTATISGTGIAHVQPGMTATGLTTDSPTGQAQMGTTTGAAVGTEITTTDRIDTQTSLSTTSATTQPGATTATTTTTTTVAEHDVTSLAESTTTRRIQTKD